MAEYLGYQGRPEPVDWLKIAKGAITDINAIEADRQKQRDSLEKSADDLVAASKEYKPGQSGSFNELILNGADRVRSTTLDLKKQLMNGQITPTEYKARVGRMSEDWKYLGEFSKSYNDIIAKQIEYLNDPKASKLGEFFLDKQSKLADVANKQLVVDPSTNGVVMTDPDTGMVVDFKSMLIPENQTPERLDVISEVEKFTKGLGTASGYVNGVWTESPMIKDVNEYQKAKANFTKSLMQSPRGAASILADYVGGYEFYETEQQKKAIESAGGKAIQLVTGPNGIATPKLTKAQEEEARAVLDRLVDSRVDYERSKPEPARSERVSTTETTENRKQETYANRRRNLMAMYSDKSGATATSYLKDMVYPGTQEKIESIRFTPDGHVQFQTYSIKKKKVKDKKKGEYIDVVEKIINPQTRAPLGQQAIGIMNQVLNTQGGDANIPIDFVFSAEEFTPAQNTQKKKLPGT
jgi:hypothetical protein